MKNRGTPMSLSEVRLVAEKHAPVMNPYHHMCLTWLLAYVDELTNLAGCQRISDDELAAIEERLFQNGVGDPR